MSTAEKKYEVTQEQVDHALKQEVEAPANDTELLPKQSSFWHIGEGGSDLLGLHVRSSQTFGVLLTKNLEIKERIVIKAGYDQPAKIIEETLKLTSKLGAQFPAAVTLSGKHTQFFLTKAPNIARPMLQKTFKLQMKQLTGDERENLPYLKLPNIDDGDNQSNYLVGTVHPPTQEKLIDAFRKARLKILAWDLDILCYARSTQFLWQKSNIRGETIFSLIVGSNRSRLLLMTENGRFIAPVLPFGISSFVDHLASALGDPTAAAQWLDESKLILNTTDTKELRQQKILANQALFTLYVPLAQQIKMHLYQACNSLNLPLPKHFSVLGPGASLFRIGQCLEMDLGLKAVEFANLLEPEMAAALGAATWDKHNLKMNTLPQGSGEMVQKIKEGIQTLQEKISKLMPKQKEKASTASRISFGKNAKIAVGLLLLASIFPVWKRMSMTKELSKSKAEFESLGPNKEKFLEFANRQGVLEKKLALVKTLEAKRLKATPILKELLFSLPPQIRLSGLTVRDGIIALKGFAQTQDDLEKYLEQCTTFQLLENPTLLNIRKEKEATAFEINLKIRS